MLTLAAVTEIQILQQGEKGLSSVHPLGEWSGILQLEL